MGAVEVLEFEKPWQEWWDNADRKERMKMLEQMGYGSSLDLLDKRYKDVPWSTRHEFGPSIGDVLYFRKNGTWPMA